MSESEVHAYSFIIEQLTKKGWEKKDIFTQQECRKIPAIKEALGLLTPENIVRISDTNYYVIESKNERKKIKKAIKEAMEYANLINKNKKVNAFFITGIAGNNEEGFIGESQYYENGKWETIIENGVELTSVLSHIQVETILDTKRHEIKDVEISEQEFLKAAETINGILHENSVNKDYRARFISAILLALSDGGKLNLEEEDVSVLIKTINAKVDSILKKHAKEDFSRFIKIDEPSSPDNHIKVRNAIVYTVQELLGLNIRSAMNSGKDVLGQFYEVFLKYGNGAKEIGIVLTPRHITRFAADVIDVKANDFVLDPTCGTGGFLVAAFDKVRRETSKKDFKKFKDYGLYGIEDQDPIISLSIVNMIFRGDGKNNMIEGDCFKKWLILDNTDNIISCKYITDDDEPENRIVPITKILMNPPFAQKSSKNKEYKFIEHALKQMQNDGILFSILPISVMIEKSTKTWRKKVLLNNNTLLGVVTFPPDLFYPIGVNTLGIFVKKGVPHPKEQNVYWARAINDGFLKKKKKRLRDENTPNDLEKIKDTIKKFMKNPTIQIDNISKFQKISPIDFTDDELELVPEAYLDDEPFSYKKITEDIENSIREYAAFLIRYKKEENEVNHGKK